MKPDLLVFMLSDPALEEVNGKDLIKWKYILEKHYLQFTKDRIEYLERMKNDDSFRFVFDEDLQYLPKDYYDVYNDTEENLTMKDTIATHNIELILFLREQFKLLEFDI